MKKATIVLTVVMVAFVSCGFSMPKCDSEKVLNNIEAQYFIPNPPPKGY